MGYGTKKEQARAGPQQSYPGPTRGRSRARLPDQTERK
jgi:hypothetical protein